MVVKITLNVILFLGKCPNCGAVLYKKAGKKPTLFCQAEGCGFSKPLEEEN